MSGLEPLMSPSAEPSFRDLSLDAIAHTQGITPGRQAASPGCIGPRINRGAPPVARRSSRVETTSPCRTLSPSGLK